MADNEGLFLTVSNWNVSGLGEGNWVSKREVPVRATRVMAGMPTSVVSAMYVPKLGVVVSVL